MNGQLHAAAFETEKNVGLFKEDKMLTLAAPPATTEKVEVPEDQEEKGGWTIAVRTSKLNTPLLPNNTHM